MTSEEATMIVEMLSVLPYFPNKAGAQSLIADEIQSMCQAFEQGVWLARRMSQLVSKWEGLREMRAIYCSKYSPKDGLDATSTLFLDGVPSERAFGPAAIAGANPLAIAAPEMTLADKEANAELQEVVQIMAVAKELPKVEKAYPKDENWKRVEGMLERMGL